jgi:hypothetical protein
MEASEFKFKFTGTSEVDVDTLINSLKNVSKTLQDISLEENDTFLQVNVKPFKEGSFEWIFAIEPILNETTSILNNTLSSESIITKFKNIVELVSFYNGYDIKTPEVIEENTFRYTNEIGETKDIVADYNLEAINEAAAYQVEELFLNVSKNDTIDGISLEKDNVPTTTVSKNEIDQVSVNITDKRARRAIVEIREPNFIPKQKVYVSVMKPDITGEKSWKINYDGHIGETKITDDDFLKFVENGNVSFINGTKLLVDLEERQEFQNKGQAYVYKGVTITKVHQTIQPPTQGKLELG